MSTNNHPMRNVLTSNSPTKIDSVEIQGYLEIPVISGEMTPEFLNASWEKIRDVRRAATVRHLVPKQHVAASSYSTYERRVYAIAEALHHDAP